MSMITRRIRNHCSVSSYCRPLVPDSSGDASDCHWYSCFHWYSFMPTLIGTVSNIRALSWLSLAHFLLLAQINSDRHWYSACHWYSLSLPIIGQLLSSVQSDYDSHWYSCCYWYIFIYHWYKFCHWYSFFWSSVLGWGALFCYRFGAVFAYIVWTVGLHIEAFPHISCGLELEPTVFYVFG